MSIPVMGYELAELQPVPVPIFRLFEWSSENSPQEGVSDVLSSQLGGRAHCDSLKKTPAQMRVHFESLVLATMTHLTKSPVSPLVEIIPTACDRRYVSLSSNAFGSLPVLIVPAGCGAIRS
jgi:hypothetical protein